MSPRDSRNLSILVWIAVIASLVTIYCVWVVPIGRRSDAEIARMRKCSNAHTEQEYIACGRPMPRDDGTVR